MAEPYDLVIVGAGISGLAFLLGRAEHRQNGQILVVDYRPATGGFLGAAFGLASRGVS
jgi:glycine/D-amino acid oxidase-like deaminating enzyme